MTGQGGDTSRRGGSGEPGGLPERIGRYRILGELGRGGMGVVYLGEDPDLTREVAIKTLPNEFSRDVDSLARFQREARLLAALNHPNIATIYSLESEDDRPFLTMERIRGRTLSSVMSTQKGLSKVVGLDDAEAVRIGVAISKALEAAHDRGVIHRDLKPGNVMIREDGEVRVLDFGLAMEISSAGLPGTNPPAEAGVETVHPPGEARLDAAPPADEVSGGTMTAEQIEDSVPTALGSSSSSTGAGTPGYMSPEQIRGEPLDPRSDIFALGCVLYECCTGTPMIGGNTPHERVTQTLRGAADPEMLASVPSRVAKIIEQCLEPDVERRPAGVRAVRRVLEEVQEQWAIERLARDRGREAPTTAPKGNLPQSLSTFVGRETLIGDIRARLREDRLVTLTGAGGSGKTRLAIEAARGLTGDQADGVWLIELGPLNDERSLDVAVMKALSLEDVAGQTARDTLVRHLGSQSTLLILDNCEHVVAAVAALVHEVLAQSEGTKFLATSREVLGVTGEHRIAVPPLDTPGEENSLEALRSSEAVCLFEARAQHARADFEVNEQNAKVVAAICRRLDGLPLALELAASRVRVMNVQELHDRLDDRFRILTGGSREKLPRQRTLHASIEWSYDHLNETERLLLRRLSVFAGGWTLEAAETVCAGSGLEDWEVLDTLTMLIDKSLVEIDFGRIESSESTPRYRMLETVRAFASEQLEETEGAVETRRAFVGYVFKVVEGGAKALSGPEAGAVLGRFRLDYDNIRDAIRLATQLPDVASALSITAWMLRYWFMTSSWSEGARLLTQVLELPGVEEHPVPLASALNSAGAMATRLGDSEGSIPYLRRAAGLFEEQGLEEFAAMAVMNMGNSHSYLGQYTESAACHERVLELGRRLGNDWLIAASLTNLSNVCEALGQHERLGEYAKESAEIFERLGDQSNLIMANNYRGIHAYRNQRWDEALHLFNKCIETADELGDRYWTGMVRLHRGATLLESEGPAAAEPDIRFALEVSSEMEEPMLTLSALESFANMLSSWQRYREVAEIAGAVEANRRTCKMPRRAFDEVPYQQMLEEIRAKAGDRVFMDAFSQGERLTLSEAVTLAASLPGGPGTHRAGC